MRIDELFGIFRNNERHDKAKEAREKLKKDTAEKVAAHRAKQADKNKKSQKDDDDDEEGEDDKKKKPQTRSSSTNGTRPTSSASGGRAAERDWINNS